MDDKLNAKFQEWMTYDKSEKSRAELNQLKEKNNYDELRKRLLHRMEFGTAGLRSRMGAGYSMMNDLTIIQTAQGLLSYMQQQFPDLEKRGLVVGYDGRYNSKEWAKITANIFLRASIPVYLYSTLCPTPFVPFGVTHFKAAGGVMVTASHNPKDDNGYKVYWNNGAQIIPPHDEGIATNIESHLKPRETSWDVSIVDGHSLLTDPLGEVMKAYYAAQKTALCHHFSANQESPISFVYTAMHGVGYRYIQEIMKSFGFRPPIPVTEQVEPDPEFPTVPFPNPEEGKSALDLAMKTATENNASIILANDPDADRLAVAEKQQNGSWTIFTGNEIGTLFGWWSWFCWRTKHPKEDPSKVLMLASTVSSKILRAIAQVEGFAFEETLTGFKWMGNVAEKMQKEGYSVLFAFEEAIGFMCGDVVLDKDGVGASAVMAELATYVYTKGCGSLAGKLKEIYTQYGYHATLTSYYFCYEKEVILSIFNRLRCWNGKAQSYPPHCGGVEIIAVRDLTTGHDSNYEDKKARLPVSSSSQMVTFSFKNGCILTIRTSGTEPKIKFYSEICADPQDQRDWSSIKSELSDFISQMIEEFYEPKKNGLVPRSE